MAIPGKKPTPTKLKMLRGNPGRRPLLKHEPRPTPGAPPAPDWLDPLSRQTWDRIVPELEAIGILTQVDAFVLEAFCVCYAHWVELEQAVAKIGPVYQPSNKKGSKYLQQVPHVTIALKYLDEARAFAAELGLSPSSRARIGLPSPRTETDESNDRLEEFFRRNGI